MDSRRDSRELMLLCTISSTLDFNVASLDLKLSQGDGFTLQSDGEMQLDPSGGNVPMICVCTDADCVGQDDPNLCI